MSQRVLFVAVRWDLGAVAAVGSAALTGSGFTLVVLAPLLHCGMFGLRLFTHMLIFSSSIIKQKALKGQQRILSGAIVTIHK